jgi:hypothetical protein
VRSYPQRSGIGQLYKRKDFGAEHITVVLKHLQEGLIERYADHPVPIEIIP